MAATKQTLDAAKRRLKFIEQGLQSLLQSVLDSEAPICQYCNKQIAHGKRTCPEKKFWIINGRTKLNTKDFD